MRRTSKEGAVHEFVLTYWTSRGYGPSYREIADGVGIRSPNGVKIHIDSLMQKGVIARDKGRARTIRPTRPTEALT